MEIKTVEPEVEDEILMVTTVIIYINNTSKLNPKTSITVAVTISKPDRSIRILYRAAEDYPSINEDMDVHLVLIF